MLELFKNLLRILFMPKTAVVIPKYGLIGGAEQFAAELTSELCNRTDHTFQVFANRWQSNTGAVSFQKIPVISFPKFLTTISFAWFVQNRLRRGDFDLVHSHERIFAADLFTLHGVPHRYWVHNIRQKSMSLYDRATAWVERKLVYEGGCSKFVAVSHLTREIFLREYPIDPKRVAVIHPGVNLSGYARKDKDGARHATRSALGAGDDDLVIIFASMNFEIKGLDDIIHALAQLKGRFKLVVAGKGNVNKYENIAREAGVADHIIFTGIIDREKLTDLYLAGDLYMMLSKFDTFGMVVLEAMAAGLPVIISSHVGAKDLVEEKKNGFIITDPSDHGVIASKIKFLFDEKNCKSMSDAAFQTATQNTWEKVADGYSDIYENILAAKNRKGR